MPAGLQVINASGSVQIDETYKNFRCFAKGTVTTGAINTGPGVTNESRDFSYVNVNSNSKKSIIAFRCPYPTWTINYRDGAGNVVHNIAILGASRTLEYWLFDDTPPPDLGYGMQVFTDQGEIAFDATAKYLRVKSFVSGTFEDDFVNRTYPVEPGIVPAIIPCLQASASSVRYSPISQQYFKLESYGCLNTENGIVRLTANFAFQSGQVSGAPAVNLNRVFAFITCDVANY